MISLVLEASTYAGSAALLHGSTLLASRSVAMRGKDHEALMDAVGALLRECGLSPAVIGRVVCGAGPGSFTSLRIAAAVAKGISEATGAILVPVSSLALLVASGDLRTSGRYLAVMDAMRGESYAQEFVVNKRGEVSPSGQLSVVTTEQVDRIAEARRLIVVGPTRQEPNALTPEAGAASNITKMIDETPAADLAAWEPLYGRLAEAQVKWEALHGRALELA
ncbi:MAG: tRNA (adenosine(37)-N6)-threonylcarbamoyltransferase complex dimerization subunit type 1 TsaB [Gemmatimonadota bacterium]|nr:tRNA (adenosine(37)-N6)-threonylcarbamoyltransferase complex dimerization subunit type 1 TsaB [Gemmatimonadota bacterium]